MALGLRSASAATGRYNPRSVTDSKDKSLRSVRGAYGPQGLLLMVRKAVAGSKNGQLQQVNRLMSMVFEIQRLSE
ncbi:hypothetical protein Hanom_Chr08g00748021 [Helianthus anomalus]